MTPWTSRSSWSPTKSIMGQYIMLNPNSLINKETKQYIENSALDEKSIGRVVKYDDDYAVYKIRWITKFDTILENFVDSDLLYKSGNFIFLNATRVDKYIQHRLWFEDPVELPDVEPVNATIPELADLIDDMRFKGGKKSRKNRKSVKGGKSRKLYKKFCKSRKLRKSRNVRKTRRR